MVPAVLPPADPAPALAALRARLHAAGLRATQARLRVLAALAGQRRPLSHAELMARLRGRGLDRATVFRNLADLTRVGMVLRRDAGDHVWRFELAAAAADVPAHPHFLCTACGIVRCLPEVHVEIRAPAAADPPVPIAGIDVQLRGRCGACAAP